MNNKIQDGFRFNRDIHAELLDLAKLSGMDKTEIVEIAIKNVRPVVIRMMRERLNSLEKPKKGPK